MTAFSSDPVDPLVSPQRAAELDDNRAMNLDLARATGDPALMTHVHAVRYCEELLFVHEALAEIRAKKGQQESAQDEQTLCEMARQLGLHHLDVLDLHLFQNKP